MKKALVTIGKKGMENFYNEIHTFKNLKELKKILREKGLKGTAKVNLGEYQKIIDSI
jgi:hypothetical protein